MIIIKDLYYSAFISERKREKCLKKINNKKNIKDIFLLIYRHNNSNLLEIVNTKELFKLDKREKDIYIIGIFVNKDETYQYIAKLALQSINNHNQVNKETLFKEIKRDA